MRAAEEERRRARRERDEAVRAARVEAERVVSDLRSEVASARESLERETLTEPALDHAVARAERELGRLPEARTGPPSPSPSCRTQWRLGDRARSRSGGWEGRIAALERGGKRATLEAGGMRVTVDAADLVPAFDGTGAASPGVPGTTGSDGAAATSNASSIRLERARSVASSLDLRGARVDEALDALARYLDDAALAGLDKVIIIHGLGTGALRDAVRRRQRATRSCVRCVRASAAKAATERRSSSSEAAVGSPPAVATREPARQVSRVAGFVGFGVTSLILNVVASGGFAGGLGPWSQGWPARGGCHRRSREAARRTDRRRAVARRRSDSVPAA